MIVFKNDCSSFSNSSKRVGCFKNDRFFEKTKRSFLKMIVKRSKKRSLNDRFQKRLPTLNTALTCFAIYHVIFP